MVSIRLETGAGVADLPWTVGERDVALLPQHLGLVAAGAALAGLAQTQRAFAVAGRQQKG